MDCDRENCLCTSEVGIESKGHTYCSDYCAGTAASARSESGCNCGHAGCSSVASGTALG
jgi:hypothetical protein